MDAEQGRVDNAESEDVRTSRRDRRSVTVPGFPKEMLQALKMSISTTDTEEDAAYDTNSAPAGFDEYVDPSLDPQSPMSQAWQSEMSEGDAEVEILPDAASDDCIARFPREFGCPYIPPVGRRNPTPQCRRRHAENVGNVLLRLLASVEVGAEKDQCGSPSSTRSNSLPPSMKMRGGRLRQQVPDRFGLAAPSERKQLGEVSLDNLPELTQESHSGSAVGSSLPVDGACDTDVVFLFDWDDTLFPTWFVSEVVMPCLPPGSSWDSKQVLPDDSPFADALKKHADAVYSLIREAMSIGKVAIVTLAQRPWVVNSAARFLPGLDFERVLETYDIPVIYARECLRKTMASRARAEEGVNIYTIAKQAAMRKILKKLYGKKPWRNVISVGDSIVERDAIREVLWGHKQDSDVVPSCKTVKLMEEPSPDQLGSELALVGLWLRQMALHPEDFDVVMDDSEEMMHRLHEQFAP